LIALGLLHARIVRPLTDEEWAGDAIHTRERRTREQELLPVLGAVIADPLREVLDLALPVRRDRLEERREVRRTDDVDPAREEVGRERETDERRVSAVAAAQDRDLVLGRDVLADRPPDRIDEIVVVATRAATLNGVWFRPERARMRIVVFLPVRQPLFFSLLKVSSAIIKFTNYFVY
jgi:hypothetical protein